MSSEQWLITKWIKKLLCSGSLRASIQLKWENKSNVENVLFSTNHELFPVKFFGAELIPNITIKRSKNFTKAVKNGEHYHKVSSRVTFRTRSKTADAPPIHVTPPCPTQPYQPAKNHLHPLTSWPLTGGWRQSVSFPVYQLLFIYINEIKSSSLVHCLLQPYTCLQQRKEPSTLVEKSSTFGRHIS